MSKFKDSKGHWITQGLFIEYDGGRGFAMYTLADHPVEKEGKEYKSLKHLYIHGEDVTEYLFARSHLGGWQHWQKMCNSAVLLPHINKWREELELYIRSKSILNIMSEASSKSRSALTANKWLADKGWEKATTTKTKSKKTEKTREKIITNIEGLQSDWERIQKH